MSFRTILFLQNHLWSVSVLDCNGLFTIHLLLILLFPLLKFKFHMKMSHCCSKMDWEYQFALTLPSHSMYVWLINSLVHDGWIKSPLILSDQCEESINERKRTARKGWCTHVPAMDLTPSRLGIEQVAKQQAQASLEGLNLNWSDWSVLLYLFIFYFWWQGHR